jgi:uncharacterized membrane protein YhaH (DUF805 family)
MTGNKEPFLTDRKEPFLTDFDNPYAPPRAAVADVVADGAEFQPVKLFSAKGRIGRLRYWTYLMGGNLVFLVALMIVWFIMSITANIIGPAVVDKQAAGATMLAIIFIFMVPYMIFAIIAGIQRSHDMNWSGWSILLLFIPLVGLIWLLNPGTQGANRFGPPPPPNSLSVKILAPIFSIVVLGITWIILLSTYQSYQGYVKRVNAMQNQR